MNHQKKEASLRQRELAAAIEDALERANPCYVVIWKIWEDSGRELSALAIRRVLLKRRCEWTPAPRTMQRYLNEVAAIRNQAILGTGNTAS